MLEVVAFEQKRFARCLRQGIREAIPEVQPCWMPTSLAEIATSPTRNTGVGFGDWFEFNCGLGE